MIFKTKLVINVAGILFMLHGTEALGQSVQCDTHRGSTSPCWNGDCDSAAERNLWQPGESTPMMIVRIAFIVFRDDNGEFAAESVEGMEAQFEQLFEDFIAYNIWFDWINDADPEDYYVDSTQFLNICDPVPSGHECMCPDRESATCDPEEYEEAAMMQFGVNQTGLDSSTSLNVFILHTPNRSDFPWYADVDTYNHGVKMSAADIGGLECGTGYTYPCRSLTHEVGHALGLWHPFESYAGCTDCTEPAFCDGSCGTGFEECDETGDLCCDTPASPYHELCQSATGTQACAPYDPYPTTDYDNYMGYAGDSCWDHFTTQQVSRMHCWVCNAHPGWIVDDDCNDNDMPDVCDITRGIVLDCNENGVPDECEGLGRCCIPSVTCWECEGEMECDLYENSGWELGTSCLNCAMAP